MRELDSWDTLVATIDDCWPITGAGPGWRSVGDPERVEISREACDRSPLIIARSTVIGRDRLDPERALRLNTTLRTGALSLRDGVYELVAVRVLGELSFAELDRITAYLINTTRMIRTHLAVPDQVASLEPFVNYAD